MTTDVTDRQTIVNPLQYDDYCITLHWKQQNKAVSQANYATDNLMFETHEQRHKAALLLQNRRKNSINNITSDNYGNNQF